MINVLSRNMTQVLLNRDIIEFDDFNVYLYGFQLMFATIFKGIGLIFIGIAFGYLKEIFIFIAFFSTLRVYAGGYHSKTYLGCFLTTLSMMFISIWTATAITHFYVPVITLSILIVSYSLVFKYAPVDTENKRLNDREYKKYRKISLNIVFIQIVLIVVMYVFNNDLLYYCNIGAIAIFFEGLTLINNGKVKPEEA